MKWNEIFYISRRDNWYFLDYYQRQTSNDHFRMVSLRRSNFESRFWFSPKQARTHTLNSVQRLCRSHSISFNFYYDAVKWKIFDDSFIRYNWMEPESESETKTGGRGTSEGVVVKRKCGMQSIYKIQPWMCSIDKRISIFIIVINNIVSILSLNMPRFYSNQCIKNFLRTAHTKKS